MFSTASAAAAAGPAAMSPPPPPLSSGPGSVTSAPSAPSSAGSTPHSRAFQSKYSCILCKKRKIRCDRQVPCSSCLEAGAECVPGVRAPYFRRKRPHGIADNATVHEEPDAQDAAVDTPVTAGKRTGPVPNFGQSLWHGLTDEFSVSRTTKAAAEAESQTPLAGACLTGSPFSDPISMIIAGSPGDYDLRQLHPSPTHSFMLWQTFVQNVNPLSKLIHAPSVQPEIIEATRELDSMSRSSVALVFAIYAAAVMSMREKDCETSLGESRRTLLARYISATQQAMAAAGLMKALDLTVLQAFVLYLLSARQLYDPQAVWLLTGMAVRMGQRLGLHQERDSSQISVFEREIRRRVWWQILLVDGRGAQLAGTQGLAFSDGYSFPLPTNLNDADISPGMTGSPLSHMGPTELIFCLLRYELGKFLNTNARSLHDHRVPLEDKDRLVDGFESHVEANYLRYCDPAIPLHLLSMGVARTATCKMRLMAHHPSQHPDKGASMPQSERDMLFSTSTKMVEYDVLGRSTHAMDCFAWHMDVYFQLDAVVFMLIESQSQQPGPSVDRAWSLVSDIYKFHPALLDDESNELFVQVGNLVLRSWDVREANLERHGLGPVPVPMIVTELRSRLTPDAKDDEQQPAANINIPGFDLTPEECHPFRISATGGQPPQPTFAPYEEPMPIGDGMYMPVQAGGEAVLDYGMIDWDHWNNLFEGNKSALQWLG